MQFFVPVKSSGWAFILLDTGHNFTSQGPRACPPVCEGNEHHVHSFPSWVPTNLETPRDPVAHTWWLHQAGQANLEWTRSSCGFEGPMTLMELHSQLFPSGCSLKLFQTSLKCNRPSPQGQAAPCLGHRKDTRSSVHMSSFLLSCRMPVPPT